MCHNAKQVTCNLPLIAYDGPAVILTLALYSLSITISPVMFLAKRDFCSGANYITESINRL